MTDQKRFPFGAPVEPCGTEILGPVEAFLLGAYPSALHVRWEPPAGAKVGPIAAIAVDNEPEVFWDGRDAESKVAYWKARIEFDEAAWGTVVPSGNGPSGRWLEPNIYEPLAHAGITDRFITDCLPTYRMSDGGRAAIEGRYNTFAAVTPGLQTAYLDLHPTEDQIVSEATTSQRERLLTQIQAAQPRLIVTLGQAASRVLAHLADLPHLGRLQPDTYGRPIPIALDGSDVTWFPLVHPAVRDPWKTRHNDWLAAGGFKPHL